MQHPVGDAVMAQDADGIGADAEIGGMPEAHHAAIAEDEVEAECRDREDEDAGEKVEIEGLAQ